MPKGPLEELLRKTVEVRANGITYKGVLLEVGPEEIVIRTMTSQIAIPLDRILSVTDPKAKIKKPANKFVDKSYFDSDES
ncbi:MAG: hypothetical protein V1495_07620 [Pseudomonadota bacterium]